MGGWACQVATKEHLRGRDSLHALRLGGFVVVYGGGGVQKTLPRTVCVTLGLSVLHVAMCPELHNYVTVTE